MMGHKSLFTWVKVIKNKKNNKKTKKPHNDKWFQTFNDDTDYI